MSIPSEAIPIMGLGGRFVMATQVLPDELFRLVVFVNAGKNHSICSRTVIQREFQEFFGLFDRFAGLDLHDAEIGFRERLKVHEILEQRLDL